MTGVDLRKPLTATPYNMRDCESRGLSVVAYDELTGETFSATSGDYFFQPEHRSLVGEFGNRLVLASRSTQFLVVRS